LETYIFFLRVTELLEILIEICRGLEMSCGVFRLDPKIVVWPLTKTEPIRAECSKNIAMRDE
jgi:hypothetical protein